jgi:hypothetical protein
MSEEELKTRLLERREAIHRSRAEDPTLIELQKVMTQLIAQLRQTYRFARPNLTEGDHLGDIIYEATFLRDRKHEEPDFDTAALEIAVVMLCAAFGDRGMTRDLALGQIILDANLAIYARP